MCLGWSFTSILWPWTGFGGALDTSLNRSKSSHSFSKYIFYLKWIQTLNWATGFLCRFASCLIPWLYPSPSILQYSTLLYNTQPWYSGSVNSQCPPVATCMGGLFSDLTAGVHSSENLSKNYMPLEVTNWQVSFRHCCLIILCSSFRSVFIQVPGR